MTYIPHTIKLSFETSARLLSHPLEASGTQTSPSSPPIALYQFDAGGLKLLQLLPASAFWCRVGCDLRGGSSYPIARIAASCRCNSQSGAGVGRWDARQKPLPRQRADVRQQRLLGSMLPAGSGLFLTRSLAVAPATSISESHPNGAHGPFSQCSAELLAVQGLAFPAQAQLQPQHPR